MSVLELLAEITDMEYGDQLDLHVASKKYDIPLDDLREIFLELEETGQGNFSVYGNGGVYISRAGAQ